jgi:IclR family acetate operon transcriptional repressor
VGYGLSREEQEAGVSTMAAPIDRGASPFVLALSAPTDRFEANFDAYLAALLEVAQLASSSVAAAAENGDRR